MCLTFWNLVKVSWKQKSIQSVEKHCKTTTLKAMDKHKETEYSELQYRK
jgi:cytochrome oxidase assembly protein ShyY1